MAIQQLYLLLERKTPVRLKGLVPESWRAWLGYQLKVHRALEFKYEPYLRHKLVLPPDETEQSLFNYLADFRHEQGRKEELRTYLHDAFRRFLYTLQIVPGGNGRLLEIGAGPYFTSLLLRRLTDYKLEFINYYGPAFGKKSSQAVISSNERVEFEFYNINVEEEAIPVPDEYYDVVLLCEVLEHFTNDPVRVLLEIKRVLKPDGHLILSTPNVNRLANVWHMIYGGNIYDPYSGYGPYGRHNREYTRQELEKLLTYLGFEIDLIFISDVHDNPAHLYTYASTFSHLLEQRKHELGQYIFARAKNTKPAREKRPKWLYRGYPVDELEDE
jgi:SAM-dependent methyltransferase